MDFFQALQSNPLLQMGIIAGLLASLASGVVGTYAVVKRIVFLSGSIAHSVLGGMGFFLWLNRVHGFEWAQPMLGALLSALLSALLIAWVRLHFKQREDSIIATLWSVGMAIGLVFLSQTPGSTREIEGFFVGNILYVSKAHLGLLLGLDALLLLLVALFHRRFVAICFDEDFAQLQGVSKEKYYFLLLTMVAMSVVVLIQLVGIVLVITMLTLPPTIANLFTVNMKKMMILASVLCGVFCSVGIMTAYQMAWPAGASIVLISAFAYALAIGWTSRPPSLFPWMRP